MDDHIIKAAKEAGFIDRAAFNHQQELSRFYTIAFKAGMERAAEIAYDKGLFADHAAEADCLFECATAIRAHAQNQPKPIHDADAM